MSELFFVLKTFAFTILILLALQMRIGSTTVEQRSLSWMRQSTAIEALRGVADGAVTVAIQGGDWARHAWNKQFGSSHSSSGDAHVKKHKAWETEAKNRRGDEVD